MKGAFCIMGLSNVGKSSLFNYLVGERLSIVMDTVDTTVDYLTYNSENFTLIDTCGLHSSKDIINEFSGVYLENSEIILYVIDGRKNDFSSDREIINFLIRTKKIWLIVNFVSDVDFETTLPHDKLFVIGYNFEKAAHLKNELNISHLQQNRKKIVIIGACNVGKSTMFNALVKLKRSRVSEIAGTTRDNVTHEFVGFDQWDLIDTAGYKNIEEIIDSKAANMRNEAIEKSNGLLVVIDGSQRLTNLDKELINLMDSYGTFGIIVVNKNDIFNEEMEYFLESIHKKHMVVRISAINNKVNALKSAIETIERRLNNFVKNIDINSKTINGHVRKITVSDDQNRNFNLKGIKLTDINPLTFMYDSYLPIKQHNESAIKNFIIKQFKLFGCRTKLVHKRTKTKQFVKKKLFNKHNIKRESFISRR